MDVHVEELSLDLWQRCDWNFKPLGYEAYVVERASGGIEQGVLAGQTPTAIVLHREGGQEVVIPRANVGRMYVSQLSAMPGDLEQQVSESQMADLLQYLMRGR